MRIRSKLIAAPLVTIGMVVGTASTAFAHHCINVSRSAQGNTGAAASNGWETLSLEDLYGFLISSAGEFGLPPADVSDIPAMVAAAKAAGVPDGFVVNSHATASGGLEKKEGASQTANGKGIDFLDGAYGEQIFGAYFQVAGA